MFQSMGRSTRNPRLNHDPSRWLQVVVDPSETQDHHAVIFRRSARIATSCAVPPGARLMPPDQFLARRLGRRRQAPAAHRSRRIGRIGFAAAALTLLGVRIIGLRNMPEERRAVPSVVQSVDIAPATGRRARSLMPRRARTSVPLKAPPAPQPASFGFQSARRAPRSNTELRISVNALISTAPCCTAAQGISTASSGGESMHGP